MAFKIRRVVTAHDANGKATVGIDSLIESGPGVATPEAANALIWTTDSMPPDLSGERDPAAERVPLEPKPGGTIFRVLELPPGTQPYMHKTETLDYAIVLDGEIDMLLDDSEVHLQAGDVLIQHGTYHGWTNRGDRPCRIAFVLIDASGEAPPNYAPRSRA